MLIRPSRLLPLLVAIVLLAVASVHAADAAAKVALRVDPSRVVSQIDEKIYGHFLEHIYHSANGGLWGDIVWNRSFEEPTGRDDWRVAGGVLHSPERHKDSQWTLGDNRWQDYEFTLEVQKLSGDEVVIGIRGGHDVHYALVLGAQHNTRHALQRIVENRKARTREATTVHVVTGGLMTDRWYRVRIRCQGPHIEAWLHDQPIADHMMKGGPSSGPVSVGTRNARAEFRSLKVATLDGRVLFEGLPSPARHWLVAGNGSVALEKDRPLNSAACLKIVGDKGETGVWQPHLCLRKGEPCRGSLWLRGDAPDGVVVRVLDGAKTLAEQTLPAPTGEWKEYPLELSVAATAEDARLSITARGKAAVWLDQVSLMPDSARATGGFRPDLLQAVADLRPPVLRWPGGSFVFSYKWKNGIGPQHTRVGKTGWDEFDPLSMGVDEFMTLCRKVGAEPIMVIHVSRKPDRQPEYIADACDWVEYCNGTATSTWGKRRAENGHPEPYRVRYWEIDNEVWGMKPEEYTAVVRQFVPAMKKVDPSITTIACGSGQLGDHWREGDVAVIRDCADVVDYLSIHHYESPLKFADGPAHDEKFWRGLGELVAKSKNPKLRFFVSEWNAQTTDWRTGLYAGAILNAFERNPLVGMAAPALFLRHVSAPAWDNAFINFDQCGWFPAPNYVVMKLWRDHYAPQLLATAGDAGPLSLTATRSADGKTLYCKAVNPTTQPVAVTVTIGAGFTAKSAELLLVNPGDLAARNTLAAPHAIQPAAAPVAIDGPSLRFTLPAISAGVMTVR